MMKPEYDRLVRAFLRLQKESPARQAEYLAKLQLDDPDQANALRHLLYRDQNLSTAEDSIQYGPVRPEIGGYRLFEQIGKGGMSRVHRGQHTRTGWLAAVKLLRSDSTSTILQDIERLRQEAQIIRNLEHPNIVNVIDFIQTETEVACIMELIDGPTMANIIQTPGLTMIQALNAAIQLCDTLSVVHAQGVIHRDIKPKNIMVVAPIDGTWNDVPAIKLLDFGLAKTEHSNAEQFSLTGQALGTPQYMAPEQLIGNHVSWATDIYAFGEVFYEMLTGQPAFPNQSTFIGQKMSGAVPTLRLPLSDELTKHLRSIIYGCLATNPNARPNIEQLQTQLTNILHEFDADSAQRRATDSMHHATKADARASRDVRVAIIAIELEPVDLQWEQAPQEMAHALRRHDEIVQESLDQHGGEKLKDDGTSRLAYFRDGRGDPIACALDLQAKFQSERWHDLTQLRIKIGIHCAQLPEAIAKRPEVASSRIVQTMNLASGGQILLTQAAAETLMTPAGAEIIYLGSHRLNGSRTVDRLYSITHPILKMRDIPRLPSAVERARHLPRAPTPFINRKQEIEQVTQLLADPNCTLVTIVGAGGLGKTRLATHVATMVADHYRDGIDFVSLEGVVNRADAVRRIVEAVGLMVNPGPSPESQLQSWLYNRQLLLILDNAERVENAGHLVEALLDASPQVRFLVTSRQPLKIRAERTLRLEGFEHKLDGQADLDAAIDLFRQGAEQADPSFVVEDNLEAIKQICHAVRGVPLAIEIASSWARLMSCDKILEEIQKSMDFLSTNLNDIPLRHRSMRGVFESTWAFLKSTERTALENVTVFQGAFDKDAATKICEVTLHQLSRLDEICLIYQAGNGRFGIHPLLRSFAEEKLQENKERASAIGRRHANHYIEALADHRKNIASSRHLDILDEIDSNLDDYLAAVTHGLAIADLDVLVNAIDMLLNWSSLRDRRSHGAEIFEQWAKLARTLPPERRIIRGWLQVAFAMCAHFTGAFKVMEEELGDVRTIVETEDDERLRAHFFHALGNLYDGRGYYDDAKAYYSRSEELHASSDAVARLHPVLSLASLELRNGDWQAAEPWLEKAIHFLQPVPSGLTIALLLKGDVDVARNRFDEADSSYRRGLQLGRELNGHQLINRALRRLANSQQRNGRPETAVDMLTEAIDLARQTGDGFGIADSAVELAGALMAAKRLSKAQAAAQEGFVAASHISNPTYLYKLGLLQARLWKQAKKKQRADEMLMALDAQVPPHHPLRAAIDEALTEVDPEYSVHERDFGTLVDTIMAGVI